MTAGQAHIAGGAGQRAVASGGGISAGISPRAGPEDGLLAPGYQARPFWWDDLPPPPALAQEPPRSADVVIVGSGYTGLHAALETAGGGRRTVVLDAQDPGWGCSTRNGGQISTSIKPGFDRLAARHGPQRARAIRAEGAAALDWIGAFIQREGIDCDFRRSGRFHAAHSPQAYEVLCRAAERLRAEEGIESHAVPRAEQRGELGSGFYHGGLVYPRHASVHPGRYHRGLLLRALERGVSVVAPCGALAITPAAGGFDVTTATGTIRTRNVAIATNGYTGGLVPWLQRRVIPIGSHIIATEPLAPALMDRLFPTDRIASDSRRVVYYYRPSPDRQRILFGGRVTARESDPRVTGPRLHARLAEIFPELAQTRISHSWGGMVAYTFDELAHTGRRDGIHYAMGYCGSGVSMASYLGMRLGQKILGLAEGRTAFDDLPFPTRPLYSGRPWFLPAAVAWYAWRDGSECRRAARLAPPELAG